MSDDIAHLRKKKNPPPVCPHALHSWRFPQAFWVQNLVRHQYNIFHLKKTWNFAVSWGLGWYFLQWREDRENVQWRELFLEYAIINDRASSAWGLLANCIMTGICCWLIAWKEKQMGAKEVEKERSSSGLLLLWVSVVTHHHHHHRDCYIWRIIELSHSVSIHITSGRRVTNYYYTTAGEIEREALSMPWSVADWCKLLLLLFIPCFDTLTSFCSIFTLFYKAFRISYCVCMHYSYRKVLL